MKKIHIIIFLLGTITLNAQNFGNFSGNFQFEGQTYKSDSAMEAKKVPEQLQSQGFFNLNYSNGGLTAGIRYEHYLNPLQGIETSYKGQGIANRFISYSTDFIEITAGNFYEQFGSGIIFRTYEEKALGIDNAMDGARFRVRPINGIDITGIWGTQRNYWTQGEGIIRGGDVNFSLNELLDKYGTNITAGASVISVFQADRDFNLKMPENVLAWSGRAALFSENYSVDAEYSYKYNNPNVTNRNTYNPGYGFILNGSYFDDGFSATLNLHKIDNMDFRSDRNAVKSELMLNFIPPITKQHAYRLTTMYPYSTQINGEAGMQAEVNYMIPKGKIGGKYGTDLTINCSQIFSIDTTKIDEYKYESPFFGRGDDLYFQDINIALDRKFSNDFKGHLSFYNIIYDRDRIENSGVPNSGKVYSNVACIYGIYKLTQKHALKLELQHQWAEQDSAVTSHDIINGNWLGLLAELTISPGWYITIYDDFNYGNANEEKQIHYFNGNVAYTKGSTRLALGYGRQRAGILCVGGVCRQVPASNGFYFSLNTAF
ncbi:MAG: DUF6029 family protein [Bacteroidetes bacterium]|nr:DUF6029 family protein [Bacteroidota bacterium]